MELATKKIMFLGLQEEYADALGHLSPHRDLQPNPV